VQLFALKASRLNMKVIFGEIDGGHLMTNNTFIWLTKTGKANTAVIKWNSTFLKM
jgi:hypothetical protein